MRYLPSFAALLWASYAQACYESDNGKCTIGIEHFNNEYPGGTPATGAGSNTHVDGSSAFIKGTDCVLTRFDVESNGGNSVVAYGNYGGLSGGNFRIDSYDPGALNIDHCTISFYGRNDHGDETFDSTQVPEGVCDTYTTGGPFSATSGCRCRFDCQ